MPPPHQAGKGNESEYQCGGEGGEVCPGTIGVQQLVKEGEAGVEQGTATAEEYLGQGEGAGRDEMSSRKVNWEVRREIAVRLRDTADAGRS